MTKELNIQLKEGQQTLASFTFETGLDVPTLLQRIPELLRSETQASAPSVPAGLDSVGERYKPLAAYLDQQPQDHLTLTFEEVEEILGSPLPATARGIHTRSWWANTATHSQGRAWQAVGWRVTALHPGREEVTFTRS